MIDDPKTKQDEGSAGGQASQDITETGNLGEKSSTESEFDTSDDMAK